MKHCHVKEPSLIATLHKLSISSFLCSTSSTLSSWIHSNSSFFVDILEKEVMKWLNSCQEEAWRCPQWSHWTRNSAHQHSVFHWQITWTRKQYNWSCISTCVTMYMDHCFWLRFAGSCASTSLTLVVGAFSSTVMSSEPPGQQQSIYWRGQTKLLRKLLIGCQGLHRPPHAALRKCAQHLNVTSSLLWQ